MDSKSGVNFQTVLNVHHAKRNHVKQDLSLLYNFCHSFLVHVEFTLLLALGLYHEFAPL
jgi:hypothetical protein